MFKPSFLVGSSHPSLVRLRAKVMNLVGCGPIILKDAERKYFLETFDEASAKASRAVQAV